MEYVKKNSLTSFFVISYLITIICVVGVYVLRYVGGFSIVENALFLISVTSPTIAATMLAGLNGGLDEIKKLYSSILKWKVNPFYFIAGFALMFVPLIIGILYLLLGGELTGSSPATGFTMNVFLLGLIANLYLGPLSEELGWRGYALPKLESRFSALYSSIIIGVLWASWHLPFYLIEERTPFYIYFPLVIALTILFTWAYNNTGGSILVAVVFHFSFNFTGRFITNPNAFNLMPVMLFNILGSILIVIWVAAILIYLKPRTFSRKPDSEMPYDVPTTPEKPKILNWLLLLAFVIISFILSFILPPLAII